MTRLLWHTYRSVKRSVGYDWFYESVLVAVTIHWMAAPVVVIAHKAEPLEVIGRYTSGIG